MAKLKGRIDFEVRIIGQGSQAARWKRYAKKLGLQSKIQWLGALPPSPARQHFEWAHVLAFSSLRDTTGSALFQALETGLPVVALDHQGARDIITEECGLKVPVNRPSQVVDDLAAAIEQIAAMPEDQFSQLCEGALQRAKELSWYNLGQQIQTLYNEVTQSAMRDAALSDA